MLLALVFDSVDNTYLEVTTSGKKVSTKAKTNSDIPKIMNPLLFIRAPVPREVFRSY